jgi:hypothetical protein
LFAVDVDKGGFAGVVEVAGKYVRTANEEQAGCGKCEGFESFGVNEEKFQRGQWFPDGEGLGVVFVVKRDNWRAFGNAVALEDDGLFAFLGERIIDLLGAFFCAGNGEAK